MSSNSSDPPLSIQAVLLTVTIGEENQLMSVGSCGPPVLWLGTHRVQLPVPIGDDGKLISGGSCGPPILWLSTHAVH